MHNDTLYCISCGTADGEYTIVEHVKFCRVCSSGVLLHVNEMIDVLNDLQIQGLIPEHFLLDRTEQVFSREDLDFDNDMLGIEAAIARDDALKDMYDDINEGNY